MPGRDSSKLMQTTAEEPSPMPAISSQEATTESH